MVSLLVDHSLSVISALTIKRIVTNYLFYWLLIIEI